MMPSIRFLKRFALVATLGLSFGTAATSTLAQSKTDPIRILVGFPAGGSSDAIARSLANGLQRELGRNVIVENRPGAGGQIAAVALKNSTPDGTTLFLARAHYLASLFVTRSNQESTRIRTMGPPHISGMSTDGRTVMLGTPDGSIRLYDGVATGITPRLTMLTTPKSLAVISTNGYYRTDEASEAEIVFVTLSKTGMETLTPAEFAEQTKRKNQPGQVKVLGR